MTDVEYSNDECKHKFNSVDLRGHWHCTECGINETVYLRTRVADLEESVAFVSKSFSDESKWHENAVKDKLKAITERDEARRDAYDVSKKLSRVVFFERRLSHDELCELSNLSNKICDKYKDAK